MENDGTHGDLTRREGSFVDSQLNIDKLFGAAYGLLNDFVNTRDKTSLDAAVKSACYAAKLVEGGIEVDEVPVCLFLDLAAELSVICEENHGSRDHEAAIAVIRNFLQFDLEDGPDTARALNDLAYHLFHNYRKNGMKADLDEAVLVQKQAVARTTGNQPLHSSAVTSLGRYLSARWELNPNSNDRDLEDAIAACEEAVYTTPPDDPQRILTLYNLGDVLEQRYDHRHESSDLDRGIGLLREALTLDPPTPQDKAMALTSLGDKLQSRFERSRLSRDLDEAIEHSEEALRVLPAGHTYRHVVLDNLGNKYSLRFESFGKPEDLQASLSLLRKGVEAIRNQPHEQSEGLNNLATALWTSYLSTGDVGNLQESIEVLREAAARARTANSRAVCLANLGFCLRLRFAKIGAAKDLEECSEILLESWNSQEATIFTRVRASVVLLKVLPPLGRLVEAAKIAEQVVGLLPTVDRNLLSPDDLQHLMSTFMDVASAACSVLLACSSPEFAIYSLERSRAVALGHTIDQRNSLLRLREDHASIGLKLEGLLKQVNIASLNQESDLHHSQPLQNRRSTYQELQECFEELRTLPGYADFFASQTLAEIQETAAGGSIVFVNVAELRSDAIIVTAAAVKVLSLPQLLPDQVSEWREKARRKGRGVTAIREKNQQMVEYLRWLWGACVRGILADELVIAQTKDDQPPRVWWIGCGLAASMPFHAAGIYEDSPDNAYDNAYDRSISSYTPSVKALSYARKRQNTSCSHDSILIATMATTPDEKALPESINEKNALLRATRGAFPFKHLAQPSSLEVMDALADCTIAHFACHAGSHPVDPQKSCLILQRCDAAGTPEQDHLTVGAVQGLRLDKARIAYLSACQTGENRVDELADEVTHLITAFQMAGFSPIVRCLWPTRDDASKMVADEFYSKILQEKQPSGSAVALALRDSVSAVRMVKPGLPLWWAPFVHVGP